jgi:thiol:disulfide interchange protein
VTILRSIAGLTLLLGLSVAGTGHAFAGGDWNDAGIAWQPYAEGLAKARKSKKPICLVFFTEWCPHCTSYSKVFHDAKVVERSKRFVMVRLDRDQNDALSKEYAFDGAYIPRTYFLSSAGTVDPEIHAPRADFKYFYDESDPASVLAGMDAALQKLGGKKAKKPRP